MPLATWRRYFESAAGGPLRAVIVESWTRSLDAGVDPTAQDVTVPRVSADELQQRREANATMIDAATPHVEWLSRSLRGIRHVVYLVDLDGVILHVAASGIDAEQAALAPGYQWSEQVVGTNGAGTAIAADQPVAIVGSEHLVEAFHQFTCTAAPIHDPGGKVIGAIDITTDAANGSPERLIAVAHAAFVIDRELTQRHAIDSANAATAARDRLLAEVSHEIRTPLTAIIGWAQFVRTNRAALDEGLPAIEQSAFRLSVLVADLLEMSRIATGKMHLECSDVDLAAITSGVVSAMSSIAESRGISLSAGGTQRLVIRADARRLEQVVTNLLANALKFTPDGGTVTVHHRSAGDVARLVVSDTGCGIDPAFLPHVFDYLRQGPTTESSGGLGLGLAIVREIVQLHGGHVTAASDGIGRGATFTVDLPLRQH